MDLSIEACFGMSPVEVLPIIFQEQIASGRVNLRDYAPIGYITGMMEYCFPKVTKKNSERLVKLLQLENEIHPHFFYFIQQQYDNKIAKELKKFNIAMIAQLDKEEQRKEQLKLAETARIKRANS